MSSSVMINVNGNKAVGECYGIAVGTGTDAEGNLSDNL